MIDIEIWEPHQIERGECLEAQVGPLQLWLRKAEKRDYAGDQGKV
jgi:hypothetical protein